jgi:hypothetical protein
MEDQGTVYPSHVANEVLFDLTREKQGRTWMRTSGGQWNMVGDFPVWTDDDAGQTDEDISPSADDHIYAIDGPGFADKRRSWDEKVHVVNLRESVIVSIYGNQYQCSDFLKWHSKVYVQPKNDTELTRAAAAQQSLGSGWIAIGSNP